MKLSINLLQESQKIQSRIKRLGLMLQSASIVVLVVFGLIVFGLLSYSFIIKSQLEKVGEEIVKKEKMIELLRPIESIQVLVKQKASFVSSIVGEQSVEFLLASDLYKFSQGWIAVRGVQVLGDVGAITMSGSATDVFSLIEYFSSLSSYVEEQGIARVRATSITRGPEGNYLFGMIFDLVEE